MLAIDLRLSDVNLDHANVYAVANTASRTREESCRENTDSDLSEWIGWQSRYQSAARRRQLVAVVQAFIGFKYDENQEQDLVDRRC